MDEVELGLEGRFFDYRLSAEVSFYNRATLDLDCYSAIGSNNWIYKYGN